MENSHKIKFGDVTSITRQYCDLMDGNGYKREIINKKRQSIRQNCPGRAGCGARGI